MIGMMKNKPGPCRAWNLPSRSTTALQIRYLNGRRNNESKDDCATHDHNTLWVK